MTFALRCLSVSLAFFFISYCVLSTAVAHGWRFAERWGRGLGARRQADLLFFLRFFPALTASAVTLALVVPSFLLLEPRASGEPVGEIPLALGGCCLLLFSLGVGRAMRAYRKTTHTVDDWLAEATAVPSFEPVPLFRIRPAVPALAVAGMWAPRVLLSDAAATVLSRHELDRALKHEWVHVRRWDNLKKLMFLFWPFAGMSQLESAWTEASEMAADDAAVASASDALDLASALIKLSRLAPVDPPAPLTTAVVGGASVNARVARLVAWDQTRLARSGGFVLSWYAKAGALGTTLGIFITYGAVLRDMHALTELLVR
jgi:Zn-dependent protease with chaperone function